MRILLISISLVLQSIILNAQSNYVAKVNGITKSDYYNIELSQEIIAVSPDLEFSSLRINDKKGKEIPYFVRSVNPIQEISSFVDYDIIKNTTKDSLNTIVIENKNKENLNRFYIVTIAAEVVKNVRLKGSNNEKEWYVVKQEENITHSGFKQGNEEYLIVDFPSSNYKYYEITLSNNQNNPLSVQRVGKFENSNIYAQLSKINVGQFIQKDSTDKKTYISFPELQYPYRISKINFKINNKSDYLRYCYFRNEYDNINFTLSSKEDNNIFLPSSALIKTNSIIIENKDNPPLSIDSISFFGLNRYLCAYLEEGNEYIITINEKNYSKPQYDIEHFKNEISQNLEIVKTSDLKETKKEVIEREKLWLEKPVFLWGVIIIVGVFLLGLCWKVILEMKKK